MNCLQNYVLGNDVYSLEHVLLFSRMIYLLLQHIYQIEALLPRTSLEILTQDANQKYYLQAQPIYK